MERLTSALRLMERDSGVQFLVALFFILVLKWDVVARPPVWDTAMGLFPAAITLADNGFDVIELLGMPDFFEGGPNTHSTSPVTFATAVVLKVTGGGDRAFVILHLLHFAAAALALVLLFGLARPVFGGLGSFFLCLSVLLYPVFSAQVGFLYMEVPLFLCAVAALHAFADKRFRGAVLWSALAYATKEAGIIVPATLAVATLIENRPLPVRLKRVGLLALFPVLWTVTIWSLARWSRGGSTGPTLVSTFSNAFGGFWHYLDRFLFNVPDLLILIFVFLAAAVFFGRELVRALVDERPDAPLEGGGEDRQARRVLGYGGIMIVFFLLLPSAWVPRDCVPRPRCASRCCVDFLHSTGTAPCTRWTSTPRGPATTLRSRSARTRIAGSRAFRWKPSDFSKRFPKACRSTTATTNITC